MSTREIEIAALYRRIEKVEALAYSGATEGERQAALSVLPGLSRKFRALVTAR